MSRGNARKGALKWTTTALAAVLGMMGTAYAQAQDNNPEEEDIVVTATRRPADPFTVPVQTTVITAEDIERNLANDIKDVVRFEPGVSVPTQPSRFTAAFANTGRDGNSGFTIRGLGGNRVLFTVDGVRVPDGFSFGPNTFGRGDYLDLDLVESIEILRGPASALYGSDGLAGAVSFTTKDPRNFLRGEDYAGRARLAYGSADDSWSGAVSAAGQWGQWSGLIAYTRRESHETENQGENDTATTARTTPNPMDIESSSVMGRLVFEPSDNHRFRLTADYGDREMVTEVLSARSIPPLGATSVLDLDGLDTSERSRISLDYTWVNEGGIIDRAYVAAYSTTQELYQFSDEDRNTAADRTRIATFDTEVQGFAVQLDSNFSTGSVEHNLIYGGDYSLTNQEGIRDGTVPPVGETFPTRAFPITEYTTSGLFIQDEISFADGRVLIFPAVRYDSYELDPQADPFYPVPAAGQKDDHISPRLGIVAWPFEHVGFFANYAEGFRAPSPNQINQNFSNTSLFYTSIPNPNLRPETSEGIEIGVRLRDVAALGGTWRASATSFQSWYEDFITDTPVQVAGPPIGTGSLGNESIFQVINIGQVDIWGVEGRAQAEWDNGVTLNLSAALAQGDQTQAGVTTPLETIDPFRLVAGLGYDAPSGRWGGQIVATHSARKEARRTAATSFRPDSFTILDITGYWAINDDAMLRAGVFNVTDEKYWWWSDVRGLTPASAVRDAFTQPGLNFSASISYRF